MAFLSALVAVMYLIGAGALGLAAYHHDVGLRTLAVMLPMLALTMQVGGVSGADVSLEQMLAAVPDVDGLVARLDRSGPAPPLRGPLRPAPADVRATASWRSSGLRRGTGVGGRRPHTPG